MQHITHSKPKNCPGTFSVCDKSIKPWIVSASNEQGINAGFVLMGLTAQFLGSIQLLVRDMQITRARTVQDTINHAFGSRAIKTYWSAAGRHVDGIWRVSVGVNMVTLTYSIPDIGLTTEPIMLEWLMRRFQLQCPKTVRLHAKEGSLSVLSKEIISVLETQTLTDWGRAALMDGAEMLNVFENM